MTYFSISYAFEILWNQENEQSIGLRAERITKILKKPNVDHAEKEKWVSKLFETKGCIDFE